MKKAPFARNIPLAPEKPEDNGRDGQQAGICKNQAARHVNFSAQNHDL